MSRGTHVSIEGGHVSRDTSVSIDAACVSRGYLCE